MNRTAKRKCEMWISNNKVLVGGSKKPHARNPNFETEETKLLISLWGDPKVQKTLITTHKKHPVIMKLAEKMREHGYYRSAEEINTRIKNLKCFYNRIKKDLELGVITEPTWKHYGAMEEIINRPVFGNRVQQPHLQNLPKLSGTDTAAAKEKIEEEDSNQYRPEDLLCVEEGMDEDTEMDFEDGSLIPKEEPVDIDDMEEPDEHADLEDVNDIFPKLSQYLQLASNGNQMNKPPISPSDIKQSPPSSPTPSEMKIVQSIASPTPPPSATPPAQPQKPPTTTTIPTATTIITTTTTTAPQSLAVATPTTTAPSKISLVPTNYLMKPQQQSISFNQSLFCAKSASGTAQAVYTTTNGTMPMKVLLVNALPKPTPAAVAPAQASPILLPKKTLTTQLKAPLTRSTTAAAAAAAAAASGTNSTTLITNKLAGDSNSNGAENRRPASAWKYQKGTPGFRSLLHQLVQVQVETLAVSKQRLEIEKKRMEFEQNIGDKLVNILQTLASPKQE